tara:strand:- start:1398 stop:1916 length:519 start_codon:yes stop_codon:yes gene_type:complete
MLAKFSRKELLSGLEIESSIVKFTNAIRKDVKLENKNVCILLDVCKNKVSIYGFFNLTRNKKEERGVTRCALLFLIRELKYQNIIRDDFIVEIDSPTVIKNKEDKYIKEKSELIDLYTKIGFKFNSSQKLVSTINDIENRLKDRYNNSDDKTDILLSKQKNDKSNITVYYCN